MDDVTRKLNKALNWAIGKVSPYELSQRQDEVYTQAMILLARNRALIDQANDINKQTMENTIAIERMLKANMPEMSRKVSEYEKDFNVNPFDKRIADIVESECPDD